MSGLSQRDKRLLVGTAFFAEVVLGWFFLIDPAMSRLARLQRQLDQARSARAELAAAAPQPGAGRAAVPGALPPPLPVGQDEAPELAIQRHLAEVAGQAEVRVVSVTVAEPTPESPPHTRQVEAKLAGSYAAIDALVGRLAWPDAREGMLRLELRPDGPAGERVQADVKLLVELAP